MRSFFVLAVTLICTALFGESQREKIYVDSQNIAFDGNTILINIDSIWMKTHALYSDGQGMYIDGYDSWMCPVCKYINPEETLQCFRCNYIMRPKASLD